MAQVLRQSTQVIVTIGPFVDVTDGFTPETGITLGAADEAELLQSNTTTTTDISGATFAAITGCDGWYGLTLTTSHTDTVGALTVMVNDDSVCLPVFARFQVIEEAAYDAIYTASAAGPATPTNITAGTITTATNVTTVNGLAANVITAASMAADASAEIADAVWDEDATAHQTGGTFGQAIGDPGADTNTIFKAVVTDATGATVGVDAAAILADTGTDGVIVASIAAGAITASAVATGAIDADALAADAGTEIATAVWASGTRSLTVLDEDSTTLDLDATVRAAVGLASANLDTQLTAIDDLVDTEVAAIKAKTDQLTFTVANQLDANIQSVNDVTVTGAGTEGDPWGP